MLRKVIDYISPTYTRESDESRIGHPSTNSKTLGFDKTTCPSICFTVVTLKDPEIIVERPTPTVICYLIPHFHIFPGTHTKCVTRGMIFMRSNKTNSQLIQNG